MAITWEQAWRLRQGGFRINGLKTGYEDEELASIAERLGVAWETMDLLDAIIQSKAEKAAHDQKRTH